MDAETATRLTTMAPNVATPTPAPTVNYVVTEGFQGVLPKEPGR